MLLCRLQCYNSVAKVTVLLCCLGYKLSYMKKGLLITKVTEMLSGLNYTVTGLTATTTYTVEIVALTGVGAGPALVKDVVTGVPPGTCGRYTSLCRHLDYNTVVSMFVCIYVFQCLLLLQIECCNFVDMLKSPL